MALKQEPIVAEASSSNSPEPSLKGGSLSNWDIWLLGLCFSMLFLLFLPLYRFFRLEGYTGLSVISDVFSSIGVSSITASMAIAAAFEGIARSGTYNRPRGLLFLIAVLCYVMYAAIGYEPKQGAQDVLIVPRIVITNVSLFIAMFVLSLWSFKSKKAG